MSDIDDETLKDTPIPRGWEWDSLLLLDHDVVVEHPYTKQKILLTPLQEAVYSTIKGAEMLGQWVIVKQGVNWFKQYHADIYMDLLD